MALRNSYADFDNVSNISSVTSLHESSTASSVIVTSSTPIDANTTEKICEFLELEFTDEKDEIISNVLNNGRQALVKYEGILVPEVYSAEIIIDTVDNSAIASESPKETALLEFLKQHIFQRWKAACINQPQIWEFITKTKDENNDHFEAVLRHTAEYGRKYTKSSSILSVVLQLLFSSIDDECLKNENVFSDLLTAVTNEGLQGCKKFDQYICQDDLNEQLDNSNSPLYLALRIYYYEKVPELLKQHKIPDAKNLLYSLVADSVTKMGWLDGIVSVKSKIPPVKYEPFQKTIKNMISSSVTSSKLPEPSLSIPVTATIEKKPPADTKYTEPSTLKNQSDANSPNTTVPSQNQGIATNTSSVPETSKASNSTILSMTTDADIEVTLAKKCINTELLQLQHLMQAGELQYINKTIRNICEGMVDRFYNEHITFSQFIGESLYPTMFLLKRQQNLDDFMKTLTFVYQKRKREQSKSTLTSKENAMNLNLRAFLHILLLNSDIFLRRTLMSLISKRNPVPLIEPNIDNFSGENTKYEVVSSIIHVWNTTRPTLLSFGVGPCRGKSSLINILFQSTFERHIDSVYFQYGIDIDFGYAFIPERSFNLADSHGQIPQQILTQICSLFEGFLIHVSQSFLEQNMKFVSDVLRALPRDKCQVLLVRDIESGFDKQQCQLSLTKQLAEDSLSPNIPRMFSLSNMTDTNNDDIQYTLQDLREQLLVIIKLDVPMKINKDQLFKNLYEILTPNYVKYLQKTNEIIQPLKKCLLSNTNDKNNDNFPLYLKFSVLCALRQELKKIDFYGSDNDRSFNINTDIFQIESELNPHNPNAIECGSVYSYFIELLNTENRMMTLNMLASELKQELLNQGADKLAGNLSVANSFLSLEVLWRNCILCYDHTSPKNQRLIMDSYIEFMQNGFPFEIIDGDNFHCQHSFLTEIMEHFQKQRILVISVIGPQNSGKSTLLNYMFGTLFDVRDGRCTRGIYGSLVKSNIEGIDYLLLIDTEGLLSVEKSDKEYDRRLVLFCLGVSHLVIVNMLGDINEVLKDMLTLCADSLKQLRVNTIQQPVVHFILNQKADPNIKNHIEAINRIISDLKDKELGEVINISAETFHTLPSAFKKERIANDTSGPCLVRTEPDFIEQTQKLVSRIITSAKSCYDNAGDMNFNLVKWLSTSITIFDTLQKFPDLTYFKDINERRQDDKIRLRIGEMIPETLSAGQRMKMIDENCDKKEQDIRDTFQVQFQVYQDDLTEKLENIFKLENASERIRNRSQQFLLRQVTEIRNAWCTSTIEVNDRKQMEALVRHGKADLNVLIDNIIKSGRMMTKTDAIAEFNTMWENKLKHIKNNFNSTERLKQAIKFVYGNYNIFEKKMLPAHDNIVSSIQLIDDLTAFPKVEAISCQLETNFLDRINSEQQNLLQKLPQKQSTVTKLAIENFAYINKQILLNLIDSIQISHEDRSPSQNEPNTSTIANEKSGFFHRAGRIIPSGVKNMFASSNEKAVVSLRLQLTPPPSPLENDLKFQVQKAMIAEMKTPANKSNMLYLPSIFGNILNRIRDTVIGDEGKHRQEHDGNACHPIEIDIIQTIVGLINAAIDEINRELLAFDLSLSRTLIMIIHTLVLFYLTTLYYNEQKQHFQQQLATLDKAWPSLLNYFISMVVSDVSCDKDAGEIFANQVLDAVQRMLTTKIQEIITTKIQTQKDLSRKELQLICDGKLSTANDEWMLKYIEQPTDIIFEEFQLRWDNVQNDIEAQIGMEKNKFKSHMIKYFSIIQSMETALTGEGSAAKFVDDLFQATSGSADQNLKNKGQCMVLVLYSYLKNVLIQSTTSFTVYDQTYELTDKGVRYFQKLSKPDKELINLFDLMSKSDDATKTPSSDTSSIRLTSIKNFQNFLKSILDIKTKIDQKYEDISTAFGLYDKDQTYIRLQGKARGCTVKCPCCQRPCDADHSLVKSNPGDEDNKHSCTTGHQLRAFAGIKFEVTNEASLYQCNEINNNDFIVVKGDRKKWAEMKLDYQTWDFDVTNSTEELGKLKSKFLYVWGKTGQTFCDKYNMTYVTNNTPGPAPEDMHYILLLDNSGSMKGTPWDNLLAACQVLIKARVDGGTIDHLTVITFNEKADLFCSDQPMKSVNISKVACTKKGTDFEPAFKLVYNVLESSKEKNSSLKHVIVFMSDGEAEYPQAQLNLLKPMLDDQIKEFWTVALGTSRMEILEQINSKMKGTFKQLKDSSELSSAFAEIAIG
ncbi:unnamed protein product [Adineta steineri]|uniref:VLIG-type G domain-containing protein n=1 Tax=Adineta steineri TaxID=433720 RepID=A0A815H164_9BILA|nr:unnamed protein product [Adineta steineri]CAF1090597.1 unnamed protein product [Adineta steineri]CAF1100548.1 unnamed protein product [Adineta steineri]CAF1347866.1 unnamed protein product [Adineta steineri]CAF1595685.1 unnamed protein product [Adineta steineri]